MTPDIFDVRGQERAEEQRLRDSIQDLENKIALIRAQRALQGATGFQEFQGQLERVHRAAVNAMLRETDSDSMLRHWQGRAAMARDILAFLKVDEKGLQALVTAKEDLQTQLNGLLRPGRPEE